MGVMVIAEPGGTGEGDYETMLRLLQTAKECGADVWKPQFTTNADRHLERRSAHLTANEKYVFYAKYDRAYHWLQWPAAWHRDFAYRCGQLGMRYACSVCLPEDVSIVAPWVNYVKVASFEAHDQEMLTAVKRINTVVIVSYGMGADASALVDLPLHCVSSYPAPINAMNLRVLRENGSYAGLSDHSRCLIAGAVAVACGAGIVETHYRLDDCDPTNPDYAVAFTPAEFTQYIKNIRDAEVMLGDGVKRVQPCELAMLKYKVSA